MKKISTNIEGLDKLFHGGIYINSSQLEDSTENNGMIILIRGPKDCHKTMLALQLAHGLSMSLDCVLGPSTRETRYYSLDKLKADLEDMYLDILILGQLNRIMESWSKAHLGNGKFKKDGYNDICRALFNQGEKKFSKIEDELARLIAEKTVYYNPRTNSLHFRRGHAGDDEDNLYARRKYNIVADYIKSIKGAQISLDRDENTLEKEFVNIQFFDSESSSCQSGYRYSKNNIVKFQDLQSSLDDEISNKESAGKCKVIVIDGLSTLPTDTETFSALHFEDILRRMATVSIIVLDGQNEMTLNGDIVIETRKRESDEDEYSYLELQIAKSVFQSAVLGWHQYKKRDYGIEIFPSIHLLLTKRDYLVRRLQTRYVHILSESYEQYLDFVNFQDDYVSYERTNSDIGKTLSEQYQEYDRGREDRMRRLLYNIHKEEAELSVENIKEKAKYLFESILFGKNKNYSVCHGWTDHFYSTAIIGNPNCYKRFLAVSGAFEAARKEEHTLFILFDKNEVDMRKYVRCPAFKEVNKSLMEQKINFSDPKSWNLINSEQSACFENCYQCHKYLHFFPIRMGCISAEEFFFVLDKYIKLYTGDGKGPKKRFHIVIDDLQRIEYSFPFLKQTSLFLSALINICHDNKVEIKILCDKKAALVNELCSLSDNIICIRREANQENRIICYIERCVYNLSPSEVFKMDICDIKNKFRCTNEGYGFVGDDINVEEIGSMKEYWRKTININEKSEIMVERCKNK